MEPKPFYRSDRATLYCADALAVLPLIPPGRAIVTDPPYGIGIAANPFRQKFARQDWDDAPASAEHIAAILAVGGEAVIWGGNYFDLPPTQCFLIWDKGQPEDFSSAMVEMAWTNLSQPAKMFSYRVTGYKKEHPTQKPYELMAWTLGFVGGDCVVDPFMGSGTTGVAALKLGRRFVGVEKSPEFCEIARRRIIEAEEAFSLFEPAPAREESPILFQPG